MDVIWAEGRGDMRSQRVWGHWGGGRAEGDEEDQSWLFSFRTHQYCADELKMKALFLFSSLLFRWLFCKWFLYLWKNTFSFHFLIKPSLLWIFLLDTAIVRLSSDSPERAQGSQEGPKHHRLLCGVFSLRLGELALTFLHRRLQVQKSGVIWLCNVPFSFSFFFFLCQTVL